ncbi:protein translocase subunit SecF, partial [Candidatus Roizmanbacteria bacterium CG10_big_fil_rev_8_21_14_0_10_39_6]
SVHDTIIIFDKLKEEEKSGRYSGLEEKINAALTLTIVRSANTSITTILVLASLVILGGSATRWFSISLLIGMFLGTYSSPFIAAPMYYFLTRFFKKRA